MGKRGKLPKNPLPIAEATCMPVKMNKEQQERERRYQAEEGLRTLNKAEEIRSDKQRMSDIKALATEQMKSLSKFSK